MLAGGDRRSTGRSAEVVTAVLADPALFGTVFAGLAATDPVVRMRAADAIEKITARQPELLRPYKRRALRVAAECAQQEVRWHMAQLIPRLPLTPRERAQAAETLTRYLEDESRIVKTFALQALADLAAQASELRPAVRVHLAEAERSGSPAMRSRARRLLKQLDGG
jgi:hypothetical protein